MIKKIKILFNLSILSFKYSKLRLGQLICNALTSNEDLFYMSDKELLIRLEKLNKDLEKL
jgi:hypothetical protein